MVILKVLQGVEKESGYKKKIAFEKTFWSISSQVQDLNVYNNTCLVKRSEEKLCCCSPFPRQNKYLVYFLHQGVHTYTYMNIYILELTITSIPYW